MKTHYQEDLSVAAFEKAMLDFENHDEVKSIICLVADISGQDFQYLDPVFKKMTKNLMGGVFPGFIYKSEKKDAGALFLGLDYEIDTKLIDLSEEDEVFDQVAELVEVSENIGAQSIFILVDAFAANKGEFIQSLYENYGNSVRYVGGGCGSLDMISKPVVISNHGLSSNVGIVGMLQQSLSIGCAHGWREISSPLKITESEGNDVISINWRPAFDVYKEMIFQHSGKEINKENFFSIAKSYPFGMAKIDAEFVVRDPIASDEHRLTIVDKIPAGEMVYLLNGEEDNLIEGAEEASKIANLNGEEAVFCVECISRVLYYEENFRKELNAISDAPIFGLLALGEIANSGNTFLEIYNKTIVITQF